MCYFHLLLYRAASLLFLGASRFVFLGFIILMRWHSKLLFDKKMAQKRLLLLGDELFLC
jgi:hypothetical protein